MQERVIQKLLKLHKKQFGLFIALRGQHVHQFSNIPREIKRVGLIETLMHSNDFLPDYLPHLHRDSVNEARRLWQGHAERLGQLARIFLATTMRSTRSIWEPAIAL